MSNYNSKRVSLIPRLSRTLWSCESRYAPRHSTLGGLSKQEWGAIATSVKAVGMSALENEVRNMSRAIQQLSGYLGNMNQSLSSRMDLMHAGIEHNSTILGLESRYDSSPEYYFYYEEDGEGSLQFQGDYLLEEPSTSVVSDTMLSEDDHV